MISMIKLEFNEGSPPQKDIDKQLKLSLNQVVSFNSLIRLTIKLELVLRVCLFTFSPSKQ